MKAEAVLVVFGGILIHFSLGVLYYSLSYLAPSIVHFTAMKGRDRGMGAADDGLATVLLVAAGTVCQGVTIFAGGHLCRKIGPRPTTFIGCFIVVASVFLTVGCLHLSFWAVVVSYGVLVGAGSGLAWIAPLSAAMRWLPGWKGVANGFIVAGFGLGFLLLVPLKAYLKPERLMPNVTSDGSNVYMDKDALDRLPYFFLILGGITVMLQVLGVAFIVDPLPGKCPPRGTSWIRRLWWLVQPRLSCQSQCIQRKQHQLREDVEHEDGMIESDSFRLEESGGSRQPPSTQAAEADAQHEGIHSTLLIRPGDRSSQSYQAVDRQSNPTLSEEEEEEEEGREQSQPVSIYMPVSLTPKQLLRRLDFFALWFESVSILQAMVFVVSYYNAITTSLELSDKQLEYALVVAAILDVVARPIWGGFCDLTSFKTTLVVLFGLMSFALLTLPALTFLSPYTYFMSLCIILFCFGGVAVALPTGVARWYGLEYAAVNYGLLYMGSTIASMLVAAAVILLPRLGMDASFGWEGRACLSGGLILLGLALVLVVKEKKFVLLPRIRH